MKSYTKFIATLAVIVSFPLQAAFGEAAFSTSISVPIYAVDAKGLSKSLGIIKISQSRYGLIFTPELEGLPPGVHGFHIHEHPSCAAAVGEHGQAAAMAAGGHWDPNHTQSHAGPYKDGHRGDLPALYVEADGRARYPVLAPRLTALNEVRGHALMIHMGGDNYSDYPKPLGGGGERIACGMIASSAW